MKHPAGQNMHFQGPPQFKAKTPHLMKSKVRKHNIPRDQHKKPAQNNKLSETHRTRPPLSQIRANHNRPPQVRSRKKPNGPQQPEMDNTKQNPAPLTGRTPIGGIRG